MQSPSEQKAEGSWKQFTGRIKEAWGAISNDDIDRFEGRRDQLEGYIQEKTGDTREAIRDRIDELAKEASYRV